MIFTHDVEQSLGHVVDLVNSGPAGAVPEQLGDVTALRAWVEDQAISDVGALHATDLSAVRALRSRLRRFFVETDRDLLARLANELLASVTVSPRLSDHDGYEWHIHYFVPGAALAEHLGSDAVMALVHVITAAEQAGCRCARRRVANACWSTCPATVPSATATAVRVGTGCTSRPTASAAATSRRAEPAYAGRSQSRLRMCCDETE